MSILALLAPRVLAGNMFTRIVRNRIYDKNELQTLTQEQLAEWQQYYNVEIKDSQLLPLINSPLNDELHQLSVIEPEQRQPHAKLTHEDRVRILQTLGFKIHPTFNDHRLSPKLRLIYDTNRGKSAG